MAEGFLRALAVFRRVRDAIAARLRAWLADRRA